MFGITTVICLVFLAFFLCVVKPIWYYFKDPGGLRKYPALNRLCGITNFAYAWEVRKGFRSKALHQAHQRHPVIRLGPRSLSFGHVAAIKDIYGHGSPFIKDDHYSVQAGTHFHLADVINKQEHQKKRKILSSAYALKNLESWEYKVADKVDKTLAQFDRLCTAPLKAGARPLPHEVNVNYRMWTNFFTIDAIADIGLSEQLGFLVNGNDRVVACGPDGVSREVCYRDSLHGTAKSSSALVWSSDNFSLLKKVMPLVSRRYYTWAQNEKDYNDVVYSLVQRRLERHRKGEKLNDFFTSLMEDRNGSAHGLELGEIKAEVGIMSESSQIMLNRRYHNTKLHSVNAGSDTTAIAMTNALYHLLRNPAKLHRLQSELSSVLPPPTTKTNVKDAIASYDSVRHLPYLRAVLDESLRLTPPTAFGLLRKSPPEGAVVCDHFIPGNITVSVSAYVAHRDLDVFPDPESFIPERWLEGKARDLQESFIAFSAGARGCIGRNISYLEQSMLLATVVNRYGFAMPYPDWEIGRLETFNLWPGDLWIKMWRRDT